MKYNVNFLKYVSDKLTVEDIECEKILENNETPIEIISLDRIRDNIKLVKASLGQIDSRIKLYYALKASYLKEIMRIIREECDGISPFSELEYYICEKRGFGNRIMYNGVGRGKNSLEKAIKNRSRVNISSFEEYEEIKDIEVDDSIKIGLRLSAENFYKEDYNEKYSKLGFNFKDVYKVIEDAKKNDIDVVGFSLHFLSNQKNLYKYKKLIEKLLVFVDEVGQIYKLDIEFINLGGGLMPRIFFSSDEELKNELEDFAFMTKNKIEGDIDIIFEFGRFIVSDASLILSQVVTRKQNWFFVDINTNYLIPAPGFKFEALPCVKRENGENNVISDKMGVEMTKTKYSIKNGDYVAMLNTGAYTNVMKEQFIYQDPVKFYVSNKSIVKIDEPISKESILEYHN